MRPEPVTVAFRNLWLPPVDTRAELLPNAEEGQLCFVQHDDVVFVFWEGRWQRQDSL